MTLENDFGIWLFPKNADVANHAKTIIIQLKTLGWIQGDYADNSGAVCCLGASYSIQDAPMRVRGWWEKSFNTYLKVCHGWSAGITSWNDFHVHSLEEVIKALEDFIEKVSPDESASDFVH